MECRRERESGGIAKLTLNRAPFPVENPPLAAKRRKIKKRGAIWVKIALFI
jgi:hypothetical protein